MCVWGGELACFVEVFQVTAPCFYGYSVSNDSPDVLPFLWFRCSASITMKGKKATACVGACAHLCVFASRQDLYRGWPRGTFSSYILYEWAAAAYVHTWNHRVRDALSFQNINPGPWLCTHGCKAMSCPKPQFVRIVHYIWCYPCYYCFALSSPKRHHTKQKAWMSKLCNL